MGPGPANRLATSKNYRGILSKLQCPSGARLRARHLKAAGDGRPTERQAFYQPTDLPSHLSKKFYNLLVYLVKVSGLGRQAGGPDDTSQGGKGQPPDGLISPECWEGAGIWSRYAE